MVTKIKHESIEIELEMEKPVTYLRNQGYLHPIKILSDQSSQDLEKLTDLKLWGKSVIGVWIPDRDEQHGLLLEEKMW